MEKTADKEKLLDKFEKYILEEHDGSLSDYIELIELSREDIFMNFYHLVRDNPDNEKEFKVMMEKIIGGKPSEIIGEDYHQTVMESERLNNELIYLLAAEQILYEDCEE